MEFLLKILCEMKEQGESVNAGDIEELEKIFEKYPKERIIVSVDVKNNELYTKHMDLDLEGFKEVLRRIDPNEIILLDISSVGTEAGFNKELFETEIFNIILNCITYRIDNLIHRHTKANN